MNHNSIHFLFIFFYFCPYLEQSLFCSEDSQEGGSQHTHLETCCSCPHPRCVKSSSARFITGLIWTVRKCKRVCAWLAVGGKGEELSPFFIKSFSSLHGGGKAFLPKCYARRKPCTLTVSWDNIVQS